MKLVVNLFIFVTLACAVDLVNGATFDPNTVVFYLYTRLNPGVKSRQVINIGDVDSLRKSNYNQENPTRFIVHGFRNSYKSEVNEFLTKAYLKNADFNIIVADWSKGADLLFFRYSTARNNVPAAGKQIGLFIDFLYNSTRNSSLDFHESTYLVGHSLGAHVCGFAGRSSLHGKPGVIIGLDPAGPEFDVNKPLERLNKDDANYVHVIHSNLHKVLYQLGISEPIGHADFYPNYGLTQEGCMGGSITSITEVADDDQDFDEGMSTGSCNHDRSFYFFAESLGSDELVGVLCRGGYYDDIKKEKCDETGIFLKYGGLFLKKNEGVYYFPTNKDTPFGKGIEHFASYSRESAAKTLG